mmetsp:Transcript_1696/g.10433  ORF Transcript_1696/g.10433 Transcript_1696/m.10433 type:complete len:300 (-) Transcript_1696:160-1059(-)
MHPVLCFIKDNRTVRLNDLIRALYSPFCWQAVHELALRTCSIHQRHIHLKPSKVFSPLLGLFLLPHGCPHISVDNICTLHSIHRRVADLDFGESCIHGTLDSGGIRHIGFWTAADEFHGEHCCQTEHGMHHVVTVSDVHHFDSIHTPKVLFDGQGIRHELTRVVVVGQTIDDWDGGVLSKVDEILVCKETCHDQVVVSAEDPSDVFRRFSLSNPNVVRTQVHSVPAEQVEPRLEGDPGPHGRLGEDHGHGHPFERLKAPVTTFDLRFDLRSTLQHRRELVLAEIVQVQKVSNVVLHHGS